MMILTLATQLNQAPAASTGGRIEAAFDPVLGF
jgi:hypothetical protein